MSKRERYLKQIEAMKTAHTWLAYMRFNSEEASLLWWAAHPEVNEDAWDIEKYMRMGCYYS